MRAVGALALAFVLGTGGAQAENYHLFGGAEHEVYLGCVDCPRSDAASVCNRDSDAAQNGDSIFNAFGRFGSQFSEKSPWNALSASSKVPVLVDRAGGFYGFFTLNDKRLDAVPFAGELRRVYESAKGDLDEVRRRVCGGA